MFQAAFQRRILGRAASVQSKSSRPPRQFGNVRIAVGAHRHLDAADQCGWRKRSGPAFRRYGDDPDGSASPGGAGSYRLTPDASGSYVNGTWSSAAGMSTSRSYSAVTFVLPDGRLLILGGATNEGVVINTGEIYNPLTDTWTSIATFSGKHVWQRTHDAVGRWPRAGRIDRGPQTYIYDPATDSLVRWPDQTVRRQQPTTNRGPNWPMAASSRTT